MSAGRERPGNLVVALAGALVAALAVIGWLVWSERGADDDLDAARARAQELSAQVEAEKAAVEAAQAVLVEITTYSFKEGEHEFAWVDKIAGQELKDQLAPNVPDLQRAIVRGKVTARGQVIESAGRVVDESRVEVVAFVDQAITDEANGDVKIEEQRVSMTMTLEDGEWLVERLELLSGTNSQPSE